MISPLKLSSFKLNETTHTFSIDIDGHELSYKVANETDAVSFNQGFTDITENDLVRWLDRELRTNRCDAACVDKISIHFGEEAIASTYAYLNCIGTE